MLSILRMPWGRRLLHFGLLGLLDEDPTVGGWFTITRSALEPAVPPDATAAVTRCARVLLAEVDGESRLREAYRCVLASSATSGADLECAGKGASP